MTTAALATPTIVEREVWAEITLGSGKPKRSGHLSLAQVFPPPLVPPPAASSLPPGP